jgi:hypothetical protein
MAWILAEVARGRWQQPVELAPLYRGRSDTGVEGGFGQEEAEPLGLIIENGLALYP